MRLWSIIINFAFFSYPNNFLMNQNIYQQTIYLQITFTKQDILH